MADYNRGGDRGDRGDRGERGDRGGRGGRGRRGRRRVCSFCVDKVTHIDYKDLPKLKKHVTERGKILPRRISGNCAKHQRGLTLAIKRSRNIALMPFTME